MWIISRPLIIYKGKEMFSAAYFTYDGIFSGQYGLRIATFEDDAMQQTTQTVPTFNTAKPAKSKRFYLTSITQKEAPTFQFTIISELPIEVSNRRDILSWLDGRTNFKELIIHQTDYEDITFKCVFVVSAIRYFKGNCIGFDVTATFDSPYQRGGNIRKTIVSDGTEEYIRIVNESDIPDEYTYPIVTFTTKENLSSGEQIVIQNETDDIGGTRLFYFKNLLNNDSTKGITVMVDNELKKITSDDVHGLLQNFCYADSVKMSPKNWLRLLKGENILNIKINGTVTIDCPQYYKIGF